jgi:plasmid maintenance system antidote protein VapI
MDRTLGHILRVAMVDAGLNQRELADKVGLTLQTVNRHINDKTPVSVPQLVRYAEVLGAQFVVAPATGLEPVTYRSKERQAVA